MTESGLWWAMEPPHARMFFDFLVIVSLITVVRVVRLALALFAWPGRQRLSRDQVLTASIDPDRLAQSALANALWLEEAAAIAPTAIGRSEARRRLRMADARFDYRWHQFHARVMATQGLLRLTLLVSLAIVCYGAYPTFALWFNDTNRTAYSAWFVTGRLLLTRLAIGLAVCIALSSVSVFFDGCLIRRKASWRLFHATALDALSRVQHGRPAAAAPELRPSGATRPT